MKYLLWLSILFILPAPTAAQEVMFFTEGTDQTYYDQGIVDLASLGSGSFEHTFPPGLPQYNDKIPCSSTAFSGTSSLKFKYTSAPDGSWLVSVFRTGWSSADISGMDSLSFYLYSSSDFPASALPMIGIRALKKSGTGEISSPLYSLSLYNGPAEAGKWIHVTFPLKMIKDDPAAADLNLSAVKAVLFGQSEKNNSERTILLDNISIFKSLDLIPAVLNPSGNGFDSHAELTWKPPLGNISYHVYKSTDKGASYRLLAEIQDTFFLDFVPASEKNTEIYYRIAAFTQGRESVPVMVPVTLKDFSDDELLDMTERYTFRYFWEGADKQSGMIRERSDGSPLTVASGGTGMGLMTLIAAHERQYEDRNLIKDRIIKILDFLGSCDRYHGAWSHWYNADTKHTIPFSPDDNGGDLVETSYVAQGLIALKNYFTGNDSKSTIIRNKAGQLWKDIEWTWYRQYGQDVLYWHWSPDNGFKINMKITGWNECLITYLLAAASPTHGIPGKVYINGWARNGSMVSNRTFYQLPVKLCPDWGGPLFWLHYSHLGINPHGLKDQYADYWQEHVNTVMIHNEYAVANPLGWKNYSNKCWGLTASDDPYGYTAHQPLTNDNGTISPTAALSSLPYAPAESLKALKYFYRERGQELFGFFGFYDAFNDELNWVKKGWLAIDQGPVAVMIENYRSGLLWDLVTHDTDVKTGLNRLAFNYDGSTAAEQIPAGDPHLKLYPNPAGDFVNIEYPGFESMVIIKIYSADGLLVDSRNTGSNGNKYTYDCSGLENGLYLINVSDGKKSATDRLIKGK
jgi:hypothetical protein